MTRARQQLVFAGLAVATAVAWLYLLRGYFGAVVLAAVLAFLLLPLVDRLAAGRVPRWLAILAVYAGLGLLVAALAGMVVPGVGEEVGRLLQQAPALGRAARTQLDRLQGHPALIAGIEVDLGALAASAEAELRGLAAQQITNAVNLGLQAIGTVLQLTLLLVVAFLLLVDAHRLAAFIRTLVPLAYRSDFDSVLGAIRRMLRAYILGQLAVAAAIGVLTWAATTLIGLPYGGALGIIAGIAALIPYLGPVLGAVPIVVVGLAASPAQAVIAFTAYAVVSTLALNIALPKVLGDAVRLPFLVVVLAFLAGFEWGGVLGMFLAVPFAATLRILYDHIHPRIYSTNGHSVDSGDTSE